MNENEFSPAETNTAIVLRLYDECFNHAKLDVADELIAPNFVSPDGAGERGPKAFKSIAARLLTAFPDIHFTIHDAVSEDDRVALHWTWEATHRGAFMNIPATGKRVRQEGMVMYRLESGKAAAVKLQVDRLGLLQQLDAVPGAVDRQTVGGPSNSEQHTTSRGMERKGSQS